MAQIAAGTAPDDLATKIMGEAPDPKIRAGDIMFDRLTAESVPEHAEIFETAVHKLRGRLMPPPGNRQPAQQEIDALVSWLESSIDESSEAPVAGHVPVQRLNRTEYANVVKDLLAVEIDPEEYLPAEIEVEPYSLLLLEGDEAGQPIEKLPGVGANLQDHLQVKSVYRCNQPITVNDDTRRLHRKIAMAMRFALFRDGPMTISAVPGGMPSTSLFTFTGQPSPMSCSSRRPPPPLPMLGRFGRSHFGKPWCPASPCW